MVMRPQIAGGIGREIGLVQGRQMIRIGQRAQAGEGFIWQELDKVKVKGKNEAVQIYTVRGTPDDLTPLLRDELAQWASFLQVWRAQQWVQAGALIRALAQQHPQQLLYALYQERVAARSAQPFDPGWDGSTQFETK